MDAGATVTLEHTGVIMDNLVLEWENSERIFFG